MPLPLTSYPGVEADPAWSPDGRQVAFVWNGKTGKDFDIYVLTLGESEPRRLTTAEGADLQPAWSPDGRWIAYQRGPDPAGFWSVHLVSSAGGEDRELLRRAAPVGDVEWSRDGRSLIVQMVRTSRRVADLWKVPLDGGIPRRVTRAPDDIVGDMRPALSPDGRMLAFCRKTAWRTAEVFLLEVTPDLEPVGEPRQATHLGFVDRPVWMPDGSRLLFEASGKGAGIWQLEVHTGRLSPVIGPPDRASQPAVIRRPDGHTALVFTNQHVEQAIWRYAAADRAAAPVQLVPSTRSQFLPQFSNDGTHLAFSSTRSGSPEIWIARVDGTGLRQMTDMRHPVTDMGHWSPDDTILSFVAHTREGRRLYFVAVPDGEPEAVSPPDVEGIGSGWSKDGRFYYYASARTGRREVWRVDRVTRAHEQMTTGGADRGFESGTGTFYYWALTADARPSLRRRSAQGDEPVQLTPRPHPLELTVTSPRGFYYRAVDSSTIYHYDELADRSTRVITIPRPLGMFTVSPGGDFVAGSFLEREVVDLMLIERFR